ncbi:MAG: type II toxin-antitoxin system VapC family toxin [Acidimicrobiales bacterium]
MAALIHLDTHVVVWLYVPRIDLLSDTARGLVETEDLMVSPIVGLELQYLAEIGRLRVGANDILQSLRAQLGLSVGVADFSAVVDAALDLSWTRDPFDRLIVAQSIAAGDRLLTADRTIRENVPNAVW